MRRDLDSYVADTHALVWLLTKDKRLGSAAKRILNQAEAGEAQVLVPIVLAELAYIAQKKKIRYYKAKLITKDEVLQNSGEFEVVWG